MPVDASLLTEVESLLRSAGTTPDYDAVLERVLAATDCVVGTIHVLDDNGLLQLTAQRGVPGPLLEKVTTIPIGKGMAGIAAERREPVQVCNLQTDDSGVAKPSAKETRMEGCISVPMIAGEKLFGTLGVAKPTEYEFSMDECDLLSAVGTVIARAMS